MGPVNRDHSVAVRVEGPAVNEAEVVSDVAAPTEPSGCSVSVRELPSNARESADGAAALPPQAQRPPEEPRYS